MTLDLTPLVKAINRLSEGLAEYERDKTHTLVRDGLVQRFEFTYEISHKTLKRYLEMTSPTPGDYDGITFAELIRTGNEQNLLLSDWSKWKEFRMMRGKTSHTYDEEIALEVVAGIPDFLDEARHLLDQLEKRQA